MRKYGPQVVVETETWLTSEAEAEKWAEEVKALIEKHYPKAVVKKSIFQM